MKSRITLTMILVAFLGFAKAQDQPLKRKPGFTLDSKTMTELGLTDNQKNTIEDLRNKFRKLRSRAELEARQLDSLTLRRQDSVLTSPQKQKIVVLRQAIAVDNKPTPAYRQTVLIFDPKLIEELTITPEQQDKFKRIQRDYNNERRTSGEKFNKVTADSVNEQEAVLTADQKQKIAAIKASIAEYNSQIK